MWILIFWIFGGNGEATGSAEFLSQATCIQAQHQFEKTARPSTFGPTYHAMCVKK